MSVSLMEDSISIGFKGPQAQAWLTAQGVSLPTQANTFLTQHAGLVMRLGSSEFMITGELALPLKRAMESQPLGVYGVARADASFLVGGHQANAWMAQVCALDTAQMLEGQLWMTQLAGVSVILIKTLEGYRFWCDISYQAYLSQTLNTICQ